LARKRIGILTGGGDVPGLNAIIKTVTYRGSEDDIEVVGLRRGWEALTHLNLEDPTSRSHYVVPLNREIPAPSTGAVAPCCTRAAPIRPK
jgi:6-phosphofructokinase 1